MKRNFGAAIIAKNEEKNIENCIKSVNKICSKIVVVDTGSSDKTPIIAAKLGANVVFHKWKNDFSEARNYAKKHLQNDWIISIDADEKLVLDNFEAEFDKVCSTNYFDKIGGISVILNNFLDKNFSTSKQHRFTRIFRNNKSFFFSGKIHEQISNSIIEADFQVFESEIIFNHFGYIEKNIEKENRNKKLLESSLEQNNEDDFLLFHLANTEFSIGNFDKFLEIFDKIRNSLQLSSNQKEDLILKTSQIFLGKNDFEKVIQILDFRSKNVDNEGFRLFILAAAHLNLQNFSIAKSIYSSPEIHLSNLVDKNIVEKAKLFLNMQFF